MTKDRVILGIDPGTIVMGYGVLTIEGNKPKLEAMGILQLNKYEDHYLRLRKIFERVLGLIDQYHPDELAIEAPFFGKNVQSMLKHPCCRNWMRQMDWQLPFAIISRRIIRYRKRNILDGRTLLQRIRAKSVETKKDACNYRHPLLIDTLLYVC